MKKDIHQIIPSLLVNDIQKTIAFYKLLGFEMTGISNRHNPDWVELSLGQIVFQFFSEPPRGVPDKPVMSGTIYLYSNNVKQIAEELNGQVEFEWGPETMDYGISEFGVRDPNGYYIAFAEPKH